MLNPSSTPSDPFDLAFISLSTIGFGDMVPMNDPPLEYATFKRDDEACFNELVDPMPSTDKAADGLPQTCSQVKMSQENNLLSIRGT